MANAKIPVRIKGQTTCFHHKGRQLELYCEKCRELACVKCVSGIHKGHLLCDISEITRLKEQEIRNFVDKTEQKELVEIRKYIASTYTLLNENDSTFDQLAKQLKEQTERLKQDLDTLTAETLSFYQKIKDDNTKLIQKYIQNLDMYANQLKQQMLECKNVLQEGSLIEIYDTECEIDSRLHLPVKPVLRTACFTPNINPRNHLELALGTCQSIDLGQTQTKTLSVKDRSASLSQSSTQQGGTMKKAVTMTNLLKEAKVLEEWWSRCAIYSICPTTDDQAWTSSEDSKTLTLLDRKGNVIQEVKHNAMINDISLSPTTYRLWACDKQNNIMELVSGQLSQRFRTKDKPRCICVTADHHIIIGMSNTIIKYTTQGQIVLTTEAAGTATPLVCSPWRITECPITNNIAVIDASDIDDGGDEDRHVVVMDTDFRGLFMYRGYIQTGGKPFNPKCIVYDSQGNIIIADNANGIISLLNGDDEMLRISDTDTILVYAVGVSGQNVLWTVDIFYNVKLLQYYE